MRGRGLRSVLLHMSQADDKADVVLLIIYVKRFGSPVTLRIRSR
jgi:hypothetical protein